MNNMLRLKDVFAMPGTPIDLTWGIRSAWFPEIESYGSVLDGDAAVAVEAEGKMRVLCIFERNFEGDRFADMHTVWFEGKSVMLVRDGGRGGSDFKDRIIVDEAAFVSLCHYIRQKLGIDVADADVASPDKLVYPEELFNFYGSTDFAAELGYQVEPKVEGFQMIPHAHRVIPGCNPDHVLVEAHPDVQMPEYMRRDGFVMQRLRSLTDEELERNPRVVPQSIASGFTQHWWYEPCERPVDAVIVKM
jgi:hypothetical protein